MSVVPAAHVGDDVSFQYDPTLSSDDRPRNRTRAGRNIKPPARYRD